jgi:hypothetical protein
MNDTVIDRLRAANPVPMPTSPHGAEELFAWLVAEPGDPRLTSLNSERLRQRLRAPRRLTAARTAMSLMVAAGGAAAIIVATQAGAPTTAQARVLYGLAADSAKVAPFTGRYIVLSEADTYSNLPGQTEKLTSVDDTQSGATQVYSTNLDLRGGTPALRRAWHRELGVVGVDALIDPIAFLRAETWYTELPTDPTMLRAQLLPLGMLVVSTQLGTDISDAAAKAALDHGSLPASAAPSSATVRDDDVYEAASDLLRSPLVQPALRSALYEVLATTSGVSVDSHATDPAGRPAIAMSRSYTQNGAQLQSITYENPTTGAVLAQTSSVHGANAPATGTSTAIYQPATSTNSMPANPYKN